MPYDANDAETKAAVKAAIAAALAEAAEENEEALAGLKAKNKELLQKLKKAQAGEGDAVDPAEVDRLETDLRQMKKDLKAAQTALQEANDARDSAVAERDKEASVSREFLVEGGLTAELAKANVGASFIPAVSALLKGKVEVKEVNGKRQALVEGKPLGEFIKEWSQGDEGKLYVTAPGNGGGRDASQQNTQNNPSGGEKKISEMTGPEKAEAYKADPVKFNNMVAAEKASRRKPPVRL